MAPYNPNPLTSEPALFRDNPNSMKQDLADANGIVSINQHSNVLGANITPDLARTKGLFGLTPYYKNVLSKVLLFVIGLVAIVSEPKTAAVIAIVAVPVIILVFINRKGT